MEDLKQDNYDEIPCCHQQDDTENFFTDDAQADPLVNDHPFTLRFLWCQA
nr:hypothetical protein [Acetobacter persici]